MSAIALWLFAFSTGGCFQTSGAPLALDPLQQLVIDGEITAGSAMAQLARELEKSPDDPRLLYNHAVAAYAAGQWDEALISLDRVESRGSRKQIRKARFQQGNTEYRLGLAARKNNLDETISHWKQSLDHYRSVLKEVPQDASSRTNFVIVQKMLVDLLVDAAKKSEQAAIKQQEPARRSDPVAGQQIQNLRNAHEKFDDARQTDSQSEEAKEGEIRTREALARALARAGLKRVNAPLSIKSNPREPSLPSINTDAVQEGVGMLEDANQLKPNDPEIQKGLELGKSKLADAHTAQARSLMALEERIPIAKEKLAILRMAKESVQKALDQVPQHKPAQETLEEINRRLADIHEEQGDLLAELSNQQKQNLENQTMMLSQALENFQQAGELKPKEQRLQKKAGETQQKLESALEKLAEKLMKPGANESSEQQAARLEGAQQALNELMGLNPSEKTGKMAQQVGEQLDQIRQQLAQSGKMPGQTGDPQMPGPGQQMMVQGLPTDAPPKLNTPGQKGPWSSPTMLRSLRDY